jgi:hypothetical protein
VRSVTGLHIFINAPAFRGRFGDQEETLLFASEVLTPPHMAPGIFNGFRRTTRMSTGRSIDKTNITVVQTEVTREDIPQHKRKSSSITTSSRLNPKVEWLLRHHHKIRRLSKIIAACTDVVTALLSAVIEILILFVLYKFFVTKDIPIEGRPWGPWAKKSVIWPTLMFAMASLVSLVVAVASLVALLHRSRRKASSFNLVFVIIQLVAWFIVIIIYRAEKTQNDLWGWSCTQKAKFLDRRFADNKVHFEDLCNIQVWLPGWCLSNAPLATKMTLTWRQEASWIISIAHIVIAVFSGICAWYLERERLALSAELVDDVGSTVLNSLT